MDKGLIKRSHNGTLLNLIEVLRWKQLFNPKKSPFPYSLTLSFVVAIFSCCRDKGSYIFVQELIEVTNSIIPSLLGFTLAGLTIIVAFGNTSFLKSISNIKYKENDQFEPSLFQKAIAIFSWGVLIQSFSLVLGVFLKVIITLGIKNDLVFLEIKLCDWINTPLIFFLVLFLFYSVLLVPKMVLNVFSFGQSHHLKLYLEKVYDKNKNDTEQNT